MTINLKRIGIILGIIAVALVVRVMLLGSTVGSSDGDVGRKIAELTSKKFYDKCILSGMRKPPCECMRDVIHDNPDFMSVDVLEGQAKIDQVKFAKVKDKVRETCGLNMK